VENNDALAPMEWIKLATRMQIMRELQQPQHAVMDPNSQVTKPTMIPIAKKAVAARVLANNLFSSGSSEALSTSADSGQSAFGRNHDSKPGVRLSYTNSKMK
jgi:hypothetical protein